MTPNTLLLLGTHILHPGDTCRITRENAASLKRRRSLPPVSPERLAVLLDDMQARGVCLSWDADEGITIQWPRTEHFPFRDPEAFRDVEVLRVNWLAALEHFGLRSAHGIDPARPLLRLPLVICDIETTQPPVRICEISVCRMEPDEEPQWFSSLLNPEQPILNTQYHGVTSAMVQSAPRFIAVAEQIHDLVCEAVFVSHSTSYLDERETKAELKRCGIDWEPAAKLNTCKLAKRLLPQAPDHKLQTLAQVLRLRVDQAHRAESDVRTTIALFEHLVKTAQRLPQPPNTLADYLRL